MVGLWGQNGSRPSNANCKEEMAKIRKDIVDFHGEMVLLVNYSNVNYTGTHQIRLIKLSSIIFLNINFSAKKANPF